MKELNLLPPERRRRLKRDSMFGLLLLWMQSHLVGLIVVTVAGLVVWTGFWASRVFVSSSSVTELSTEVATYQRLRERVAEENHLLEYLHTQSEDRVVWAGLVTEVLAALPPGTQITRISGNAASGQLFLEGTVSNRTVLPILERRLLQVSGVKAVSMPHTNLLERINPVFRAQLTVVAVEEKAEVRP